MSGGGKIIEKRPMRIEETGNCVVRYWLMTGEHYDEVCVYAEPASDEPELGETIWWGAGKEIYWGPNDSKRLVKVAYSFNPAKAEGRANG